MSVFQNIKSGMLLPIAVLCLLAMIVLPLPPILLDIFFTLNIVVALLILAKTVNVDRPLAFATFPTIILVATLMRLAMNVASTRVILLNGHEGPSSAGSVIEAFGSFVIGGQYAVGLIVFIILVVINFIVITKGTGRVSEVSARFKLDSMPGKQMAIDADLNTGAIDGDEASRRREEVQMESDFYGSMDGASKFVKGDAIAGIIILVINIIGGLVLGMVSHGMDFSTASETYILLSIGDGIVAQVPGLILSVATGIVITRAGKKSTLGDQIGREFMGSGRNFYICASILFALGIIPGMPNIAFIFFALLVGAAGYYVEHLISVKKRSIVDEIADDVQDSSGDVAWSDIQLVRPLEIQVSLGLIDWVQGGAVDKIKGLRKKLSQDLGFLLPTISIRDNIQLKGSFYTIILNGDVMGEFELVSSKMLAIGGDLSSLHGLKVREPSFGMDGVWVDVHQKGLAESLGANVITPESVLTTHISVVINNNSATLLGFDEVKELLNRVSATKPILIEEFNKKVPSIDVLVKVLRALLRDGISINDITKILSVLVENYVEGIEPILLSQLVRNAMGRSILTSIYRGQPVEFSVLESNLQASIVANVQQNGVHSTAIEPNLVNHFVDQLKGFVESRFVSGKVAVMAVDQNIRYQVQKTIGSRVDGLNIIAVQEIPDDVPCEVVSTLST